MLDFVARVDLPIRDKSRLNIPPILQIRRKYGSEDAISTMDENKVRHCNWVRFLKISDVIGDVNMVGFKIKDEIVFQVVKTILPNEEIVAYLQKTDDTFSLEHFFQKQTETVEPDMAKGKNGGISILQHNSI